MKTTITEINENTKISSTTINDSTDWYIHIWNDNQQDICVRISQRIAQEIIKQSELNKIKNLYA